MSFNYNYWLQRAADGRERNSGASVFASAAAFCPFRAHSLPTNEE